MHTRALPILVAALAGTALAQPQPAPSPAPQPTENPTPPREADPVEPTPQPPPQQVPASVTAPDAPGVSGLDVSFPVRKRYPEGTFLTTRTGRVVKARTGEVIFVSEAEAGSDPEPPMVLLPSQKLGQVESAIAAPGFSGAASMGGQVFVYRERHYLLPMSFALIQKTQPLSKPTPQPDAKPADAPKPDTDPRVEDLIRDLESQRSTQRVLTPSSAPEPPERADTQASSQSAPLLPEGKVFGGQVGRLVRATGEGDSIAFAMDNDPDSPAPAPLLVLPCSQLQRLEALAAWRGDALSVKLSGRVLTYQGRNYVLPTFVQVTRPSELRTSQ